MAVLIVLAAVTALIILFTIIRGWVLTYLWHWFAVPIFGVPELGIVQAIGISLVIAFLTHEHSSLAIKAEHKDSSQAMLTGVTVPFITLFIGYIVHLFM